MHGNDPVNTDSVYCTKYVNAIEIPRIWRRRHALAIQYPTSQLDLPLQATTENNEGGYLFVYTTNFLTVKFWDYKT